MRAFKIGRMQMALIAVGFLAWQMIFAGMAFNPRVMDLGVADEGYYLTMGMHPKTVRPGWGPVYSSYYNLVSQFFDDSETIYYVARLFLVFFLLPLGILCLSWALFRNFYFSLFAALSVPILDLVFRSNPGIHMFNCMVWSFLLAAVIGARSSSWWLWTFLPLILGMLPFLRQDNVFFIPALAFFLFYKFAQDEGLSIKAWMGRVLAVLTIFICSYFFAEFLFGGTPFAHGRSLKAFLDHYYEAHLEMFSGQPELSRQDLVLRHFQYPESLGELILRHPLQIFSFAWLNMEELVHKFTTHLPMLAQLVGLVLLPFLLIRKAPWRNWRAAWNGLSGGEKIWCGLLAVTFLKVLVVCLLLSPRLEYGLDLYIVVVMGSFWVFWKKMSDLPIPQVLLFVTLVLGVCALDSRLFRQTPFKGWGPTTRVSHSGYVKLLREMMPQDLPKGQRLLGGHVDSAYLLGDEPNLTVFAIGYLVVRHPLGTFAQVLEKASVSVVVVSDDVRTMAHFAGMSEHIQDFEQEFERYGFLMRETYLRGTRVYIKHRDLSAKAI